MTIYCTMNIKSLSYNISPLDREAKSVGEAGKTVKSENTSADRDPNGKRERDQSDPNAKEFLNDEEMQKALEKLKNFPGVKENQLNVELIVKEISRFVVISDPLGNIVRRIPESELWPLIQDKGTQTGHLINRTG